MIAKTLVRKLLITGGVLLVSVILYRALQDDTIYKSSLGRVTFNYEHSGKGRGSKIEEVYKPYQQWSDKSIEHWDGALYKQIKEEAYRPLSPGSKEKLAFYPLFPWLWKLCNAGPVTIVFLNYLLFVIGLLILADAFEAERGVSSFYFLAALLLPTAMIYYLPYAESLFLLTMSVAVWGIRKGRYWVFAIGVFLFCMTRPSALIFIMALVCVDIVYFVQHRNFKHFVRELLLKILPCLAGFFVVTGIQYVFSGSLTAYFDSLELWPAESGFFNTVRDWSKEGFGMSVFSVFFVCIPALIAVVVWGIRSLIGKEKQDALSLFGQGSAWNKDYLWYLSLLFIAANLLYTFLVSGNRINGFSRYTLAVPFFYIVFFLFPGRIAQVSPRILLLSFLVCLIGMTLFLSQVEYGGNRFVFAYAGMYLFLLLTMLILSERYLPGKLRWVLMAGLVLPCILWHTYLFNMFVSDAWIFT